MTDEAGDIENQGERHNLIGATSKKVSKCNEKCPDWKHGCLIYLCAISMLIGLWILMKSIQHFMRKCKVPDSVTIHEDNFTIQDGNWDNKECIKEDPCILNCLEYTEFSGGEYDWCRRRWINSFW